MSNNDFPIVGVGASAGGQQALRDFFSSIPPDIDAAFVVVTHLLRQHKSELASILSRFSKIPVQPVTDNLRLSPGNIYVMPEDVFVQVRHGRLRLSQRPDSNVINNSINIFFESLAKDAGPRAIGVVLSGMGSDGSEGALKIFKEGGDVLVQDPESTKFTSMPMATILKDHPDFILPPRELGTKITQMIEARTSDKPKITPFGQENYRVNPS